MQTDSFDDLSSRISQLQEALKAVEKGRNAKPEKEKQAQRGNNNNW